MPKQSKVSSSRVASRVKNFLWNKWSKIHLGGSAYIPMTQEALLTACEIAIMEERTGQAVKALLARDDK